MRQLLYFIPVFLLFVFSCSNIKPENVDKTVLFEYPVPFYLRGQDCDLPVLLGIQTNRFTYVEYNEEPWLLFDKFIDSVVNINMVNADEYIFIQLDLERLLKNIIQEKTNDYFPVKRNTCFENYFGIVLCEEGGSL